MAEVQSEDIIDVATGNIICRETVIQDPTSPFLSAGKEPAGAAGEEPAGAAGEEPAVDNTAATLTNTVGEVLIKNIPREISREDVRKAFQHCGIIFDLHFQLSVRTGMSYGLLTFDSWKSAERAVLMNPVFIKGHCLQVESLYKQLLGRPEPNGNEASNPRLDAMQTNQREPKNPQAEGRQTSARNVERNQRRKLRRLRKLRQRTDSIGLGFNK